MTAGLQLIKPSSVTVTTGTATISSNGGITCTSADDIQINGVFSATYDNYLISLVGNTSSGTNYTMYLSTSGSIDTTGDKTRQYFEAEGTTEASGRFASQTSISLSYAFTDGSALLMYVTNPFATERSTVHVEEATTNLGATISEWWTHIDNTTSYDGWHLTVGVQTWSGKICTYGIVGN